MTSEVTQTALEPCPWCGTVEHLSFQWPGSMTAGMPDSRCRVVCTHIDHGTAVGVVGPTAYGKFAAATAWNTRLTAQSGEGRSGAGEREAIARVLWDRLRDRLRGRKGGRSMPHWETAAPEEHAPYLADAEAIIAALNARQSGEGEREALREALAEAYRKGATDVHNYWVNNPGEPPRGDPEFGESASDYAAAALDIFDSAAALKAQEG